MNLTWLLRMSRWARNPPSANRVLLTLAVVALVAAIWGIEAMGWWPDWATTDRIPRKF